MLASLFFFFYPFLWGRMKRGYEQGSWDMNGPTEALPESYGGTPAKLLK